MCVVRHVPLEPRPRKTSPGQLTMATEVSELVLSLLRYTNPVLAVTGYAVGSACLLKTHIGATT
jgi:hypothetical protein